MYYLHTILKIISNTIQKTLDFFGEFFKPHQQMTGQQLKKVLKDNDITGRELAQMMNRAEETVYVWFGKPTIKRALLQKISKATNLTVDKLTGVSNMVEEPETVYGVVHHGDQAFAALRYKGFSISKFSELMNESRPTTYKWFEEKNWDEGRLMKAAHILHVPIGQLKGKGQGVQSFEKDVYILLQNIQQQLQENTAILQSLKAKVF